MKKILLFLMLALFCIPWAANAQNTLTVHDGTTTNNYVPIYGYYADAYLKCQMVYPASELTAMNGQDIMAMSFYTSQPSLSALDGTFQVWIKEVDDATLSAFVSTDDATLVYEGTVSTNGEMAIVFQEAYTYNGGNLLVGVYQTATSSGYPTTSFYGEEVTSAAFQGYSYSNLNSVTGSVKNFLPKTTFTYVPASSCPKPTNLTYLYTEGETTATVSWTSDAGAFNVDVNGTITAVTTNTYTINIQPATTYTIKVQANCGEEPSGWASTSFFSGCPASFAIPYTYGFEEADALACWTVNATGDFTAQTGINDLYPKTGTYDFVFYYTEEPGQYLISPELSGITNGLHVEFWYRQYDYGAETFQVGYSTTTNDVDAFTWGEEISASTTYQRFSANYPAGTKYVAVKHTSDDQYYLYLDDFLFEESASCLEPTNVHYADVTTTSASISWTPGASETAWDIYVTDDEDDVPGETTSITITNVEDNPYTLTNLTPATTYYVYVRALCGETDASAWSSPVIFDTKCEAMELPYSEDFLGSDSKWMCWNTIVSNTSYDGISIVGLSNPAINVIQFYRGAQGGNIVAVLPEVDAAYPLNGYQITFDAAYSNYSGTLTVGVMTDPTDASTFVEVEQITLTSSLASYTVRLNTYSGNGQYIALKHAGTSTSSYIFVGNIEVTELPACLTPTNLTVTGAKNAVISWEGEGSFEIALSLDPEVAPGDAIVATEITANEYDLSTLTTEGMHYVYVRNNCGEAGYSEWVGTSFDVNYCTPNPTSHDGSGITGVSFGTGDYVVTNGDGSASLPASAPYYGDYTSMIGAVQAGVESTIAITTGTGSYPYTFVIWVDLDNSMSFEDSEILYIGKAASGSGTLNATITIPATQTLGDYRMRIYGADSYFSSFYGNGTTNWNAAHDPCSSGTYRHAHDYTLRVLEAPSCLVAGNVAVATENITSTTAVISWTNTNGAEATYTVMQGETVLTTTAVDSYTLEGLTAATTYPAGTFTIISGCDETLIASVPAFTTACDAVTTFPWSEDFESYSAGNFNVPCWVNEHISGTGTQIFKVYTSTNGNNTTHQLQLPDMSSGTMTKLMLPEMTLPGNDYLFSIDVYRNTTSYPEEGIRVFASTDGEIEGATELAFISRNYTVTNGVIPAETTSDWYTYELPIGISGTCYIILRGESKYGSSTYMDNFAVKQIPTCLKPTALECTATTTTTATFSWTNGAADQTAWQICLNGDETNLIMANSNPFTVEGLTVATNYTAKVRAYCGEDSQSEWSNEVNFTTACDAVTDLPWNENFDAYTGSTSSSSPAGYPNDELPMCWQFLNRSDNSSNYPQVFISSISDYPVSGKCLFFRSSSTIPLYAVLPAFEEEIADLQLTFTYRNEGTSDYNGTLIVGYMTNLADATTFTTVLTCEKTTTLTEKEVLFSDAPAGSYIAFKYQGGSSSNYYLSIDNVKVEEAPACPAPTDLTYSMHANGVTVGWNGTSDSYNVQYRTAAGEAAPFKQDFENGLGGWTFTSGNATNGIGGGGSNPAGIISTTTAAHNGTSGFRFSSYSQKTDDETYDQYLVSPELTVTGELKFWYKMYGTNDHLYVGFSTTNDLESFVWTEISNSSSWQAYTNELSGDVKYIAIHYFGDYAFYAYVDDITVGAYDIPVGEWQTIAADDNTVDIPLTEQATYEVQVQGVCDGEAGDWSETLTFDFTPFNCEAGIVLNESNPTWKENFEGLTNITKPFTGVTPSCWTVGHEYFHGSEVYAGGVDTLPQVYYSSASGNHSLCMYYRALLAMPVLDESVDMSRLRLSMDVLQIQWHWPLYRLQERWRLHDRPVQHELPGQHHADVRSREGVRNHRASA